MMRVSWSGQIREYHVRCTVRDQEGLPGRFIAIVEENGVVLHRKEVNAPSLESSLPWTTLLYRQFKERIDAAIEGELERQESDGR